MDHEPTNGRHYERLVREGAARAWRAARRVAADDAAASDAVQEAFLRLADGRATPAGLAVAGDEVEGLCALAVRLVLDERRSHARRRAREARRAMDDDRSEPEPAAAEAGASEERRVVRSAIAALPEGLQAPLVLRYQEELSYAAIGRALGLSESAAHERVGRAVERVRSTLAGLGLSGIAGAAAGGSGLDLRVLPALDPPADLVRRLIDLRAVAGGGSAAAVSGAWLAVGLVAVAAVVVAVGRVALQRGEATPAPAVRPATPVAEAPAALPPAGPPRARAALARAAGQDPGPATVLAQDQASRTFVLTGRVLGADGLAVPGATLRASTFERDGKFARWSGAATADEAGAYELVVPFDEALGGRTSARLALEAGHLGYVHTSALEVTARPGARETQDVEVAMPPGERAGDYVLDLLVRDGAGAPVEGARVELTHVAPRDRARVGPGVPFSAWSSSALWLHLDEGRGVTGPDGRVRIAGGRLGAKSLWVEPSDGHAPLRTPLAITAEGAHALDVAVEAGEVLRGTLAWVDGDPFTPEIAAAVNLHAVLELNRWRHAVVAPDGTFAISGLAAAPLELRVLADWGWSPALGERPSPAVLELAPREAPYALALKRESDPRDVGVHDAELHGEAVDAVTGAGISLADFDLFVWPLRDLPAGDLERDVLPNVLFPPPVQRMAGPGVARRTSSFHEVGLAPGAYMLRATPEGRGLGLAGPVVLAEREVRAGIELRVGPAAAVDVTVTDADGAPVEGAWAFITGVGPHSDAVVDSVDERYGALDGRGSFHGNGGRRTDAGGRVTLGGLPPGIRVVVAVVHPGLEPGRSLELSLAAGEHLAAAVALDRGR